MREYRRRIITNALGGLFETARDLRAAIDWWIANDGRKPVILVGAGYSRNARWKDSGERASNLATWGELHKRLCDDLQLDRSAFDVMTVADLYATRLGAGRLHDVLLALVPDGNLVPDDAHTALLSYDAEAIITTNHLDTLLDRDTSDWCRVVHDHDVAKFDPSRPGLRQIIYYHGHRHDLDSWVARRTDYEDHEQHRPVLVARVRQLLAQHPLLAVGYSLTDPDFHALYRRTSIHMRRRQPLGLALLVSRPDPASEEYWRNLGILVATLKKGDPAAALCGFFGSARPRLRPVKLIELLRPDDAVATRMAILGEYIHDPERTRFVDSSPESDEQHLWRAVEERLSAELRQRLRSAPAFKARMNRTSAKGGAGTEPAEEPGVTLRNFPPDRFDQDSYPVRVLNEIVTLEGTWEGVAMWGRLVFEREMLRDAAEVRLGDVASLVSWIWRRAAEETVGLRPEAQRVARACLDHAERYGLGGVAAIRDDLASLGIALSATSKPQATAIQAEMAKAMELSLNGDWAGAGEAYRRALDAAKSVRDVLGSWLAAFGRWWAAARGEKDTFFKGEAPPPEHAQRDEMRAEVSSLSETPEVKAWQERADRRIDEVTKQTMEQLRDEVRGFDRDVEHVYASSAPHYAWRAWRDLQERAAPTDLQRKYLEPVLGVGRLGDIGAELETRLRLETKGTAEWIDDLAANPDRPLDWKLEAEMMGTLERAADASRSTRTERLGALNLVAPAIELARDSDLPFLEAFVTSAQKEFRDRVETPRGTHWPYREQAAAWRAVASASTGQRAQSILQNALGDANTPQRSELHRQLGHAPWYTFALTGLVPNEMVEPMLANGEPADVSASMGLSSAIADLLRVAVDLKLPISGDSAARADGWLHRIMEAPVPDWAEPSILHPAALLARALDEAFGGDRVKLVIDRAEKAAQPDTVWPGMSQLHKLETRCSVVGVLLGRGSNGVVVGARDRLLNDLEQGWARVSRHVGLNPHSAFPFFNLLIESLRARDLGPRTQWVKTAIIEIAERSTRVLPLLAPVITHDFWDADYERIRALVRAGGWSKGRAIRMMALADLLGELVSDRYQQPSTLPETCRHLPDVAILATQERNDTVVNHAGYALVAWLEVADDARVEWALQTVERLAGDPRTPVRHAASYGAARLSLAAKRDDVRGRMATLDSRLAPDKCAIVQRQRAVGRAEGERRSRVTRPVP